MDIVNLDKSDIIFFLVIGIFLFSVGVLILLFPYKTQNLAIQNLSKYNQSRYFDISSYVDWVKSRSYIIFVRIMGFLFVCMGSFIFYVLIKGIQE